VGAKLRGLALSFHLVYILAARLIALARDLVRRAPTLNHYTKGNSPLKRLISLFLLVSLLSVTTLAGQDAPKVTLPDGTEFTVVTTEEISSKTATEGDPLTFKVSEDVKVGDKVVIAKGALVKGSITQAKKAGMMGKGGSLGIRVDSTMTVDGQTLKLRSSKGKEGDDKTGTTVALVVLFGPLGFLKHGKNAKIKEGTPIKVYVDENKEVAAK
jgi:hypothetical protein